MKRKTKQILLIVFVLLAAVVGLLAWFIHCTLETVQDCYAEWDAAHAIIYYMETHNNAWPKNWAEVETSYAGMPFRYLPEPSGFETTRRKVDVNFGAMPSELAKHRPKGDEVPFKVIWLRNGKQHWWAGAEPNTLVLKYLQEHKQLQ